MSKIIKMTQPTSDLRIDLAMQRGDVREGLGWNFVRRLEKLVDELLAKPDCPRLFWIIYSARWDDVNRKIREMWQVTDKKPNIMLGQVVYQVDKAGKAEFMAMPFDIPVPESELSDEMVMDNAERIKAIPLSDQVFEKIP